MENTTNQPDEKGHDANIVLAVSGLPELHKIRNHFVTTLPTGEVTAWNMICWAKDFTRYMDEIIHEAEKAACANGGEAQGVSAGCCDHVEWVVRLGILQCANCGKPH
jgi:hypothetical protein